MNCVNCVKLHTIFYGSILCGKIFRILLYEKEGCMANSMNKKKKVKISGILTILLCITAIGIVAALGFNIYKIKTSNTGNGDTVETEKVDNEYSNEKYSIGNNPTDINKKYFKELNEAVKGKDVKDENGNTYTGEEAIAETVVKNFICQYYTWTNKDGNYDIGGMQYIYSPKQSDFETYTLYNFYKDMDLYLSKDGRSSLIEVKKVTINNVSRVDDYTVTYTDENGDEQSAGLPCVNVEASWEYDSDTKMNASEIQTSATFHVVNNNDRWEIGGIE